MGKFLFPIHRIFSVILLMPLFIQVFELLGISVHLNLVLLFVLILSMGVTALFNYPNIVIDKKSILLFIFFILSLLHIIVFSRILPVLFFLQCFLLTLFIHHGGFNDIIPYNKKLIGFVTITYIGVSLLLLIFNINFNPEGRFFGLAYSPTTFVIYLVVLLILFHYAYRTTLLFVILFAVSIILIFFSGTRTGLLLLILFPISNLLYDKYLRTRKLMRILVILFIMGIYPLADYISIKNPELVEYRIEEGEEGVDYSFATRIAFTADVLGEWWDGRFDKKIFGFGTEFSRLAILDLYGADHQLHNDFLRLCVDFGFPAIIFFLGLIYSLSSSNKYSFFIALVYLFSFYHNMVYEVFLFNTLLFMNRART